MLTNYTTYVHKLFNRSSKLVAGVSLMLAVITMPALASAHVIVTPNQAGIGQELVFNISSPNEQQTGIASLKLDIPSGVSEVVPTAKDGWTITTSQTGSGENVEVSSITWTSNSPDSQIPVGQREDFGFGAQVPAKATTLDWKAYQTYADGTVVHWDQVPAGSDDATGNAGPYSTTKVVNDLVSTNATAASTSQTTKADNSLPIALSVIALVVSAFGLMTSRKKS